MTSKALAGVANSNVQPRAVPMTAAGRRVSRSRFAASAVRSCRLPYTLAR